MLERGNANHAEKQHANGVATNRKRSAPTPHGAALSAWGSGGPKHARTHSTMMCEPNGTRPSQGTAHTGFRDMFGYVGFTTQPGTRNGQGLLHDECRERSESHQSLLGARINKEGGWGVMKELLRAML